MTKKTLLLSALLALVVSTGVRADCPVGHGDPFLDPDDPDLSGERDLWDAHGQCKAAWEDPGGPLDGRWYPKVEYLFWNFQNDDWTDRGFHNACNLERDYTRMWSAETILDNGLHGADYEGFQRHSVEDYQLTAWGHTQAIHDFLHYTIREDQGAIGKFERPIFGENFIAFQCQVLDESHPFGNPPTRVSDHLHEAWHGWQAANGYKLDHVDGPTGHCEMGWCDWFYYHGRNDFQYGGGHIGDTNVDDEDGPLFHSPAQVQVEFMCDVMQYAKKWVPGTVRIVAMDMADAMADLQFVNRAWHCYTPRPLSYGIQTHSTP